MPAAAASAAPPRPRLVLAATTDLVHDQRLQRTATTLVRAGYEVTLVGWQRPASAPLPAGQPYAQHRLRGWFQRGKLFYLEFNLRLLGFLLRQRADLWVGADLDAALPCWLRARLGGQPFGYDAHELFPEVPEVVGRPAVRRLWRGVENFLVPRARLRYTVGPALARLFEGRHPGYAFGVVRNVPASGIGYRVIGVGKGKAIGKPRRYLTPQYPAPNTQYPPVLLYQGALNAGRGLAELLAVLPQRPELRLWLCGEGDESATLRARAAGLGLNGQVEFRGWVAPPALRQLTARATLGLNLLENVGLSYYYSLANKFFDYVQAGLPQLCIDFPEYRALNAEYEVALLVPDLAPATLLAALAELLPEGRPGPRYHRLAANCRRARLAWTWEREAPALLRLYEQVLPLAPQPGRSRRLPLRPAPG